MSDTKGALRFLGVFLGLYFSLNIVYGLWITSYGHHADAITNLITRQTSIMLNLVGEETTINPSEDKPSVAIMKNGQKVIGVYEGCNSINVMIVFVAFVAAFKGSVKQRVWFVPLGLGIIYLTNLLRVALLYFVAEYWSHYFYYFHKYLFTAFIYLIVFVLWLWWMKLTHGITVKSWLTQSKK
ncbi:MAG: exosortase family protein XrtF [Cytophagales bacterium]|jgi:exosortase family protein XrtF|nr:exosortase family protein XrtF [Cytophagales bacterium]